jgi:hypothetical protein
MLWPGVALLAVGVAWAAFKGWVVWEVAHDLYNGGGAPTLDFPVFCPLPLAVGASVVASSLGVRPFPGFGFAVYCGLAAGFAVLLWWFHRVGEPERQRQLEVVMRRSSPVAPGGVADRGRM